MIFRRVLLALIAAATIATSASVFIIALAFMIYAAAQPYLGRAGAAAVVAASSALLILLIGLATLFSGRRKRAATAAAIPTSLVERTFAFLRDKPVVAISTALGAGLMAVRNPKYLGAVLRAFVEGGASRKQ